jgi:hypothetical protein
MKEGILKITVTVLCLSLALLMVVGVVGQELYWKPEYPDYAPSGMPDFDQKQDGWFDPFSLKWTFCGPVAAANSLWWLDSEFEPSAVPPPTISDGFGLVTAYGQWDDHDVRNVGPLVNNLAAYMKTNPTTGTEVHDMKQGIDQYLTDKGMNAYFYTHLYKQPTFETVEIEVMKCQDVVLLLGFWQEDPPGSGLWHRFGGHYVTVAGINSTTSVIAVSDPYIDAAEPAPHGFGMPGRVLPPLPHLHPPGPPDTVHNDTLYVSDDEYQAYLQSPSPGGLWSLPTYNPYDLNPGLFTNFDNQNFPQEYLGSYAPFNPQLSVCTEVEYAVVTSPWFAKGQYIDYAPSGMPDFDQKQDQWVTPWPPNPGSWSYCGPVAVSNSLWWYDSKFEPNPAPPQTINDHFPLVQSYNPGVWDDHDARNVQPFVQDLAWYMDTDGQRTGLQHSGTDVFDMQAGIAQYMSDKGVNPLGDCDGDGVVDGKDAAIVAVAIGTSPGQPNWDLRADVVHDNKITMLDTNLVASNYGQRWGKFYEKTMAMPEFGYIADQIGMCEDVVLLLGVWQEIQPGYFARVGGHFVTAHGVDEADMILAISDPTQDNAEQGGQGRVIPSPPHGHPQIPPDTVHNDAMYVSHDYYTVGPSPSPGGHWGLIDYNWISIIGNLYGQNFLHNDTETPEPWMGFPIYVEIEYAVVVSCRGPAVAAGSNDGTVYALDYMGNLLWSYNTTKPVVSVAMSEWGDYVVAGSLNNGLYVINSSGSLLWSKAINVSESYGPAWASSDSKSVAISADGSYVLSATKEGLYLYNNSGNQIWMYSGATRPEETITRISPDGRYIVCANYNNGEIHFFSHLRNGVLGWQSNDGSPIWSDKKGGSSFNWVAIDGCGRYVAFTSDADADGYWEVYLYDRAGTQIWSWEFNKTGYVRVDMPWDGRSVVAVNDDFSDTTGTQVVYFSDMKNSVMGWQAADGTPQWTYVPTPPAGTHDLYTVAISPNGKAIAAAPATTNIYLLDNAGAPLQVISGGSVKSVDLTFTGEYGVAGTLEAGGAGAIKFFEKTRNSILWTYPTAGKVHSVAIQKKYQCLEPFPYHDVDVTNVIRYTTIHGRVRTVVCQGYPANEINITLSNHGDFDETVEVTLYAYSSPNNTMVIVGNAVVTINKGTAPVVSITWTSTNVPWYGNYTLHATIGPVQDENNLTDNEFIDSGLVVTGLGDISSIAEPYSPDRKVNVVDVALVASKYGAKANDPTSNYDPNADIDCNYKIDVRDVSPVASVYGTKY